MPLHQKFNYVFFEIVITIVRENDDLNRVLRCLTKLCWKTIRKRPEPYHTGLVAGDCSGGPEACGGSAACGRPPQPMAHPVERSRA